jgi:hypothetical protein
VQKSRRAHRSADGKMDNAFRNALSSFWPTFKIASLGMNHLKLKLMYREAFIRLNDAELLRDAAGLDGDADYSVYLLELLGLELLLKFIYEVEVGVDAKKYSHFYGRLFDNFPASIKQRILVLAEDRSGSAELAATHKEILQEWGKNFSDLRYPYEKYLHLSEAEYIARGNDWVNAGAKLENADFRLYPLELDGFISALKIVATEHSNRLWPDWV